MHVIIVSYDCFKTLYGEENLYGEGKSNFILFLNYTQKFSLTKLLY